MHTDVKGVFVWAFIGFPVKKAGKLKQTGCFENWLSQSQSSLQADTGKHVLRCFPQLPA
jgi:hypothetical protein